jgi:type IV secretory pathway VirB2 component (pilin)
MRKMTMKAEAKLAAVALAMLAGSPAHAGGLSRATSVVNELTSDVRTMIPLVAVVILLCLGIAWGARWIRFVTLLQFGAGVILAGSAAEVVSMLF